MNYSKRKASKKQKDITSKSKMQKKRVGVRLFKGFLIFAILICIAGAAAVGLFIKQVIDDAPEITAESIKPQGYSSTIYADDGTTVTGKLTTSGANRIYKTIDEIITAYKSLVLKIKDSLPFCEIIIISVCNCEMPIHPEILNQALSRIASELKCIYADISSSELNNEPYIRAFEMLKPYRLRFLLDLTI